MTENERKYRQALKWYLWLLVLYVPVVFLVVVSTYKLVGNYTPGFAFAALWMLAWLISGWRAALFRYRWKNSN